MGCPTKYYKRVLQYFAYYLTYTEDKKLAKDLVKENSEKKLREFILKKKEQCNEKQFFYEAGRVSQQILNEADKEGCDAFNACIGGLNIFENFIGLENATN